MKRLTIALVACGLFWPLPSNAGFVYQIRPSVADVAGGASFTSRSPALVEFDGFRPPGQSVSTGDDCDPFETPFQCETGVWGIVPAGDKLGLIDLQVYFRDFSGNFTELRVFEDAFTYVDAALVDSMEPTEYSIGPDNRLVRLEGAGFPINREVEVWVGDVQAEIVAPAISWDIIMGEEGRLLRFLPPPFPGGDYPLTVDVRVVTVGGGETVLEDAFTYDQLKPDVIMLSDGTDAWRTPFRLMIRIGNFVETGEYQFFMDDVPLNISCIGDTCIRRTFDTFGVDIPPPYPPGFVDITVIGPDGGQTTLEGAYRFKRTSPLHSADRNGDGVVSLSELLRVVQFYNEGGYRCAPEGVTTEDGFLPGPGAIPEDCRPHDSDLIDWDWQVDLSELLETIQLFNFGPYTLCEDEVFFCPAE